MKVGLGSSSMADEPLYIFIPTPLLLCHRCLPLLFSMETDEHEREEESEGGVEEEAKIERERGRR